MDRAQVNVRLPRELVAEVEELVRSGRFENKTEALAEALRLLLRAHWGEALARRNRRVKGGDRGLPEPGGGRRLVSRGGGRAAWVRPSPSTLPWW